MGKLKKIENKQKSIKTVVVPYSGDGWTSISGSTLKFTAAQRDPSNGRAFSNLYSSFSLPATSGSVTDYESTWARNGMSALSQDNIIVVDIPSTEYGTLIDGRTVKLTFANTTAGTYTLYSSYYEPLPTSSDNSDEAEYFGNPIIPGNINGSPGMASSNVAFLFCDDIKPPTLASSITAINNWSDGWQNNVVPNGYPGGGTDNFRFTDVVSSSNTPKAYAQTNDTPVGIMYLDKGFAVITDPILRQYFDFSGASSAATELYDGDVSGFTQIWYTASTSALCTYYSFEKQIQIQLDLVAGSDEFYITENQTAASSDAPYYGAGGKDTGIQFKTPFGDIEKIWDLSDVTSTYITEIGLYDAQNKLLAIAKPDRPIEKKKNTPTTLQLILTF